MTYPYNHPPPAEGPPQVHAPFAEAAERDHLPHVLYGVASMSKYERAGKLAGRPNQDSTYPPRPEDLPLHHEEIVPDVYVVADGVGGASAGEIASATVVSEFVVAVDPYRYDKPKPPKDLLQTALNYADEALRATKERGACPGDAATTIVGAVRFDADTWGLVGAGDSPAYIVRADGSVEQVIEEQFNPRIPSQIYNALAGNSQEQPRGLYDQIRLVKLMPGDRLVLVSDGVVGDWANQRIAPGKIAETVRQYPGDAQGAAEALLRLPHELQESGYEYPNYGQPFMAPGEFGDLVEWPAGTPFSGKIGDDASAIVIERPLEEAGHVEATEDGDYKSPDERLSQATDEQLLAALRSEAFRSTEIGNVLEDLDAALADESVANYVGYEIWGALGGADPSPRTIAALLSRDILALHYFRQSPGAEEAQRIPAFLSNHLDRLTGDDGSIDEERFRSWKIALALGLQYLFNSTSDIDEQHRLQHILDITTKRLPGEESEL